MSSRVTAKKSQFIKCRLLGKKKRLFSLRNCLFSVGSSFFWKALVSLAFVQSELRFPFYKCLGDRTGLVRVS